MLKSIITGAALIAVALSTSGCGAIAVGYLIGDGVARHDHATVCHEQVQSINAVRMAKGQEPYPDQCA